MEFVAKYEQQSVDLRPLPGASSPEQMPSAGIKKMRDSMRKTSVQVKTKRA
jgi:hypothetical protein